MKLQQLFELRPPKDGTRDMTDVELTKVANFCKKRKLELGSARIDDKTGEVYVSATDAMHQSRTFVLNKDLTLKA
jgi:hypothetical protein